MKYSLARRDIHIYLLNFADISFIINLLNEMKETAVDVLFIGKANKNTQWRRPNHPLTQQCEIGEAN